MEARLATALLQTALLALACASPPGTGEAPCLPHFPYEDGWLGGDAAYSIPLPSGESLWLFGDTFVGRPGQPDRVGSTLVHNSIGISRCRDGRFEIDYILGRGPTGEARAFLYAPDDGDDTRWWWLFDGFWHEGDLYIGLLEVERSPPQGPLALPFRFVGMQLARVHEPRGAPSRWRVSLLPLHDDPRVVPGSALVVDGEWLHLFAFVQGDPRRSPRVLARLPLAALTREVPNLPGALQYLARDGRWRPGLDPDDARILMDDHATEMSVVWHPELPAWVATYSHPLAHAPGAAAGFARSVLARSAPALEGPWSEPVALFEVPELDPAWPHHDPDTACYAAKEHEQLGTPDALTLTYVCNLFAAPGEDPGPVLLRLLRNMRLYRPRALSLPIPGALRGDQ